MWGRNFCTELAKTDTRILWSKKEGMQYAEVFGVSSTRCPANRHQPRPSKGGQDTPSPREDGLDQGLTHLTVAKPPVERDCGKEIPQVSTAVLFEVTVMTTFAPARNVS